MVCKLTCVRCFFLNHSKIDEITKEDGVNSPPVPTNKKSILVHSDRKQPSGKTPPPCSSVPSSEAGGEQFLMTIRPDYIGNY